MNNRILELMKQADYPAPEIALRAQKLAELVVLDITNTISILGASALEERKFGIERICNSIVNCIKEDFGIEE